MLDDPLLFTVTDLKQFSYCGRVVYYERCLPHLRPRTFKMDAGRDEHEDEQKRATRRTLAKYAISAGRREFDVALTAPELKLTGLLDEVVYAADGEIFPVDYKLAKSVSHNHRLQLAAYGLLLEAYTGQPVRRGFVYLIERRQIEEVLFTPALRQELMTLLRQMERSITAELLPPVTANLNRCPGCEFRRFCNDV
ncbi:MAG: CRISPR-associated protein Cas4 [Caldilineaceae bacterium]|nr:CRISPR-associated protein Cas4 [Caldilineaceae bacterium]